jgi:cell division protein FtsQ
LTIHQVFVQGRNQTPKKQLLNVLKVSKGDYLFSQNPWEIRDLLKSIPWIRDAQVRRNSAGVLNIDLMERIPVVLWQFKKKYYLVDNDGVVIEEKKNPSNINLPFVVGKDAPQKVSELLKIIHRFSDLKYQTEAFIRISGRRWDLKLKRGGIIKLPEKNIEKALLRLRTLRDKIDFDNMIFVDLRLPQKTIVQSKKVESI